MITPQHKAELRSSSRIRGSTWVADNLLPVYTVLISDAVFERAQILADAMAIPPHVFWCVAYMAPNRVELHTTAPEWFAEMEDMINAARRPAQQTF